MSTPNQERIKLLYMRALALPHGQRLAFVREECAGDAATLGVLREMLGLEDEEQHDPQRAIGPYRLVRELGEGGFGVVWLAEQREPVARQVALKLLKPGMDSKAILARFEQERDTLGAMNHPAIARVLDAGATERGLPYFVMEYVDGQPITAYCDAHALTIAQRLALFAKGLRGRAPRAHQGRDPPRPEAHEHPHHHHRRRGQPQDHRLRHRQGPGSDQRGEVGFYRSGPARRHARVHEPRAGGLGRIDIDTRSDVYSLGVVLYEVLTGRLPFSDQLLRERGFEAMLKSIREEDPPAPSRQLREASAVLASRIAQTRQTNIEAITRELRRELEWIPLLAMRKDREARYASAKELGEDIERYLAGGALKAGPVSRAYLVRKFVKRNRALVVSAIAIGAALTAATIISLRYAASEAKARLIAQELRDVAEETLRFLNDDMLLAVDPERDGATVRVAEVLRRARGTIKDRFVERPQVQARIQQSLGRALLAAGEAKDALPLLEAANASSLAAMDADFRDQTSNALSEAMYRTAEGAEAIRRARELVADATARRGPTDPETMKLRNQLGGALRHAAMTTGDASLLDESEKVYQSVLTDRQRVLGAKHIDTYSTRQNLCLVLLTAARLLPQEPAYARADAMRTALAARQLVTREMRETFGDNDPETLASRSEELGLLAESGDLAQAAEAYPPLLNSMIDILGLMHWRTIETMGRYAWCLRTLGKHDLALEQILVALACSRSSNGLTHPTTTALARYLGGSLRELASKPQAAATLDRLAGDIFDANTSDSRLAQLACTIAQEFAAEGDAASAARWRARCERVTSK